MLVNLFGLVLAGGILLTSILMMALGGRFQKVEAAAYAGTNRPWWFWLVSLLVIAMYSAALITFINDEKTWAGWLLMIVIPVGWAVKAVLVTFNPTGRQTVSGISGDESWGKIALARLPIALVLGALALLA